MSSTIERERQRADQASSGGAWAEIDRLWLETLGRVVSRAAHEVKGALNGVSVNLEVVRARAERPQEPAAAVQRFAESASQQLETLIRMNDALLALARPVREPVEVSSIVARLVALLGPTTAVEGGSLELEDATTGIASTSVRGNAVRLAIAAALLAALERKGHIRCRIKERDGIVVRVTIAAGGAIDVSAAITDPLDAIGVRTQADAEGCSLVFPRAVAPAQVPGTHDA